MNPRLPSNELSRHYRVCPLKRIRVDCLLYPEWKKMADCLPCQTVEAMILATCLPCHLSLNFYFAIARLLSAKSMGLVIDTILKMNEGIEDDSSRRKFIRVAT